MGKVHTYTVSRIKTNFLPLIFLLQGNPVSNNAIEDLHSAEAIKAVRAAELQAAALIEEESYNPSIYSPPRINPDDLELDAVIYNPEDDQAKIEYQVSQILLKTIYLI